MKEPTPASQATSLVIDFLKNNGYGRKELGETIIHMSVLAVRATRKVEGNSLCNGFNGTLDGSRVTVRVEDEEP